MTDKERLAKLWDIIRLEGMMSEDTDLYFKLVRVYAE